MNSSKTVETGATPAKSDAANTLLRDAIKAARAAQAERVDALNLARQEDIAQLEVLEERLRPLVEEIPPDHNQFDMSIARSNPARFWVDVVAFVSLNKDRTSYEFIKETRAGRRRIAESRDVGVVADAIRDYIAERIVERERALAGDVIDLAPQEDVAAPPAPKVVRRGFSGTALFMAFVVGALAGAVTLLAYSYATVTAVPIAN